MTESQRLEIIRQMASNNNATQISPVFKSFVEDLRADILAEELIVEHGLLKATDRDVEDEVSHLASKEDRSDDSVNINAWTDAPKYLDEHYGDRVRSQKSYESEEGWN